MYVKRVLVGDHLIVLVLIWCLGAQEKNSESAYHFAFSCQEARMVPKNTICDRV